MPGPVVEAGAMPADDDTCASVSGPARATRPTSGAAQWAVRLVLGGAGVAALCLISAPASATGTSDGLLDGLLGSEAAVEQVLEPIGSLAAGLLPAPVPPSEPTVRQPAPDKAAVTAPASSAVESTVSHSITALETATSGDVIGPVTDLVPLTESLVDVLVGVAESVSPALGEAVASVGNAGVPLPPGQPDTDPGADGSLVAPVGSADAVAPEGSSARGPVLKPVLGQGLRPANSPEQPAAVHGPQSGSAHGGAVATPPDTAAGSATRAGPDPVPVPSLPAAPSAPSAPAGGSSGSSGGGTASEAAFLGSALMLGGLSLMRSRGPAAPVGGLPTVPSFSPD